MTANCQKGLEPHAPDPDRPPASMTSQTQDKLRRASSMPYTADSSDQTVLRYSTVPVAGAAVCVTSPPSPSPTPEQQQQGDEKEQQQQQQHQRQQQNQPHMPLSPSTPPQSPSPSSSSTAPIAKQTSAAPTKAYHRRPELMNVRRKRSGSEFREEGFCDEEPGKEARKAIALDTGNIHVTDAEILADLCQWIEIAVQGSANAPRLAHGFAQASLSPPITKHSLGELDIGAIINNPKLRHDVNFDRELHFRPNFDGAKGKFKLKTADEYWTALAAELELYTFLFKGAPSVTLRDGATWPRVIQVAQRRIPLMFDTIRDIITSLVPERDQSRVADQLDTKMLMQQIEKGVCDMLSVANWLSHLLKAHCAPVRDEWVDKMVRQIDLGTRAGNGKCLVNGLRELLGILEAMKLDVANHQIRHLRALLIEDTINFEQRYHLDRMARRRILVDRSQCWFAQHAITCRSIRIDCNARDRGLRVVVRGVLSLLTSSDRQGSFPETFHLDTDRLRVLRAEFRDQVYLGVAIDTFSRLLARIGTTGPAADSHVHALRQAVSAIVVVSESSSSDGNQHWLVNVDNIAVEIVRHALAVCGAATNYDAGLVAVAAQRLRNLIRPEFGMVFHEQASAVRESLTARVLKMTDSFASSSPVDIFNSLVAYPFTSSALGSSTRQNHADPGGEYLDELARRITHIAILHWRIWGSIVYAQTAAFAALMRNPVIDHSACPSPSSSLCSTSTIFDANASTSSSADSGFGNLGTAGSPGPDQQSIRHQSSLQHARRWSNADERHSETTASANSAAAALSNAADRQTDSPDQPEDSGNASGNAGTGLERLAYRQR